MEWFVDLKHLNIDAKNSLHIANKLFIEKSVQVNRQYRSLLCNCYRSDIGTIDKKNLIESAKQINNFVNTNTKHKIKEIVRADQLNNDLAIVLANVVYFQSKWLFEFYDRSVCSFYV